MVIQHGKCISHPCVVELQMVMMINIRLCIVYTHPPMAEVQKASWLMIPAKPRLIQGPSAP